MDVLLVYFKDDGQRKDFPLEEGKVVVGRQEACDYRIPHNQISREHCEFEVTADEAILRDLESRNGTFVNNKRIAEIRLRAGDHVVIGPVVFTVQIDGQPEEIQPVKTKGQKMAEQGQGDQQVVDLEAEVTAQGGAHEAVDALTGGNDGPPVDLDPISALEALASEPPKPPGE